MHTLAPRHHTFLLLALVAALSQQTAQASASSSATVGRLQYTLTDLDPNDSITSTLTWGAGTYTHTHDVSTSDGASGRVLYPGGPNTVESSKGSNSYSSLFELPQTTSNLGYTLVTGADGLRATADLPKGGVWQESASFNGSFVLSANTAVTFSVLASVANSVVVPDWSVIRQPGQYPQNGYFDWAPIQADARAYLYVGGTVDSSTGFLGNSLRTYDTTDTGKTQRLTATFSNASLGNLGSTLTTKVVLDGYATAPLTMVPELSSAAQMLLGLAGLGAVAGLRHRRANR